MLFSLVQLFLRVNLDQPVNGERQSIYDGRRGDVVRG